MGEVTRPPGALGNQWLQALWWILEVLHGYFLKGQSVFNGRKRGNNRSVMPLDVRGCTRVTLMEGASFFSWSDRTGESFELSSWQGLIIAIIGHERGIPSKRKSPTCADYVPGLCTHRPSLLPIGWSGEYAGVWGAQGSFRVVLPRTKVSKSYHLEEGECSRQAYARIH